MQLLVLVEHSTIEVHVMMEWMQGILLERNHTNDLIWFHKHFIFIHKINNLKSLDDFCFIVKRKELNAEITAWKSM